MTGKIKNIIRNQVPCYFISPHLDDAFLSAGDLIAYLAQYTKVTIITIFTSASPKPYTMAAKGFLRQCGSIDADELFKLRKKEDTIVCEKAHVKNIHLDFIDGTWRKKRNLHRITKLFSKQIPELSHLYPLGRVIWGLAKEDMFLKEEVKNKLFTCISEKDFAIFCPIGTVKHMDHILTRVICREMFDEVIYWLDFPYMKGLKGNRLTQYMHLKTMVWDKNREKKKKILQKYKTQFASLMTLFPNGHMDLSPEVYFYK